MRESPRSVGDECVPAERNCPGTSEWLRGVIDHLSHIKLTIDNPPDEGLLTAMALQYRDDDLALQRFVRSAIAEGIEPLALTKTSASADVDALWSRVFYHLVMDYDDRACQDKETYAKWLRFCRGMYPQLPYPDPRNDDDATDEETWFHAVLMETELFDLFPRQRANTALATEHMPDMTGADRVYVNATSDEVAGFVARAFVHDALRDGTFTFSGIADFPQVVFHVVMLCLFSHRARDMLVCQDLKDLFVAHDINSSPGREMVLGEEHDSERYLLNNRFIREEVDEVTMRLFETLYPVELDSHMYPSEDDKETVMPERKPQLLQWFDAQPTPTTMCREIQHRLDLTLGGAVEILRDDAEHRWAECRTLLKNGTLTREWLKTQIREVYKGEIDIGYVGGVIELGGNIRRVFARMADGFIPHIHIDTSTIAHFGLFYESVGESLQEYLDMLPRFVVETQIGNMAQEILDWIEGVEDEARSTRREGIPHVFFRVIGEAKAALAPIAKELDRKRMAMDVESMEDRRLNKLHRMKTVHFMQVFFNTEFPEGVIEHYVSVVDRWVAAIVTRDDEAILLDQNQCISELHRLNGEHSALEEHMRVMFRELAVRAPKRDRGDDADAPPARRMSAPM